MADYPKEYRYKIGDKVLVRPDLHEAVTYDTAYKMRSGPRAGCWAGCRGKHITLAGQVVTIKKYLLGGYLVEEATGNEIFTDEMFGDLSGVNFRSLL